jgi:hypothetical protein
VATVAERLAYFSINVHFDSSRLCPIGAVRGVIYQLMSGEIRSLCGFGKWAIENFIHDTPPRLKH